MSKHVAVWMDHKEAHIFHIQEDSFKEQTVSAPPHNIHHKHPRGQEKLHEHPDDAKRFFHEIVTSLEPAQEILVVGPSTAKLEFLRYVHKRAQAIETKIVGVETVDHPTSGQLVAYAKTYFKHADRML